MCPRDVTSFVHKMSPIMSTRCLPLIFSNILLWRLHQILVKTEVHCPSELILTDCVSLALRQNTKSLPFSCFSLGKLLLRSKLSRLLSSQWKKEIRSGQRVFVRSVCGLYLVFARSLHGLCARYIANSICQVPHKLESHCTLQILNE